MEACHPRHVLFLVGMHRSGTSALSAALHACGATFGENLIAPMKRVNEKGFWESSDVVALNEELLLLAGANWYSVNSTQLWINWAAPEFDEARETAEGILSRGFGSGPLEVVKDPRFCITLPFWLALCKNYRMVTSVCIMTRALAEVCHSLRERDGFPLGYGMRLLRFYLQGIAAHAPPNSIHVTFESLLSNPVELFHGLERQLPITVEEEKLKTAVLAELRHQRLESGITLANVHAERALDIEHLETEIDRLYPIESTLSELACVIVNRGRELTRIGDLHAEALRTLNERDAELRRLVDALPSQQAVIQAHEAAIRTLNENIQRIGELHSLALATIEERDSQIEEFDSRLQNIGEMHSRALNVIEEREKQLDTLNQLISELGCLHSHALQVIDGKDSRILELERTNFVMEEKLKESRERFQQIYRIPVVGRLVRAIWKYETC